MGFFLESATSEALCVVALLASILYYFATSTFEYWKNKGVAYLKPIPFFGNTVQMTTFQKSPSEIFKVCKIWQWDIKSFPLLIYHMKHTLNDPFMQTGKRFFKFE